MNRAKRSICCCCRKTKKKILGLKDEANVRIYANDPKANTHFPSNHYKTTKYTPWNFIFKVSFEQFKKFQNFYFLLVTIVAFVPDISTLSPWSILVPFILIVGTNTVQCAFEDLQRYFGDREVNAKPYLVQKNGNFEERRNKDLQVGDLLYLKENEEVPADCLLLATSDLEDGICYVETANLDGESNLKQVQSLKATYQMTESQLKNFKALIRAEAPNVILDQFQGNMILPEPNGKIIEKPETDPSVIPLDVKSVLLRGVTIRNTRFAYGVIVYAGKRTKLAQNQLSPAFKLSKTEKIINFFTLLVFLLVAIIQIVYTIVSSVQEHSYSSSMWYVPLDTSIPVDSVYVSFGYFVMLSYFIPISAFVNFEISKLSNAGFMISDDDMRGKKGAPMKVKSTHLADEMSRVHYVFTDKTGTLTQNKMVFLKCVIGDKVCEDAGAGGLLNTSGSSITSFLIAMATNHQVLPEMRENSKDGMPHFGAPTPDEIALVKGAWKNGVQLISRTKQGLGIRFSGKQACPGMKKADDKVHMFKVLATFPFSSIRKRSSVIVEMPTGEIILFCKGADDKMWELIAKESLSKQAKQRMENQLREYSLVGLRTLVFGQKVIKPEEWEPFNNRWRAALSYVGPDHDHQLDLLMDEMERELSLQGATAIEDKLQDDVPWAIEYLVKATIKVWMITGDKQETAENIGRSCKLIGGSNTILRVVQATDTNHCLQMIKEETEKSKKYTKKSLVIDGKSLLYALLDHRKPLLNLCDGCETVIVCRADPIQKAGVVHLVKEGTNCVTLSIGDGANDISMLQEAHVGVGIHGKEGTQAARTADFAIHYFRQLPKLIAVHGRYNLLRNSLMFEYSFYKNIALIGPQVWFSIWNFFSAQTFFDDWLMAWYNQLVNGLPPIAMSLFEKDLSEEILLKHPEVFQELRDGMYLTPRSFGLWMLSALWGSLVIWFFAYGISITDVMNSTGITLDLWSSSTIVFIGGIWAMLLRGALAEGYWVWITGAFYLIAFLLVWVLYCTESAVVIWFPTFFGTMNEILASPINWFMWLLLPVVVILPDFLRLSIQREYFPWRWQQLQDYYLYKKDGIDGQPLTSEPVATANSPEVPRASDPSVLVLVEKSIKKSDSSSSSEDKIQLRKFSSSRNPRKPSLSEENFEKTSSKRGLTGSFRRSQQIKEKKMTQEHEQLTENLVFETPQPSETSSKLQTLDSTRNESELDVSASKIVSLSASPSLVDAHVSLSTFSSSQIPHLTSSATPLLNPGGTEPRRVSTSSTPHGSPDTSSKKRTRESSFTPEFKKKTIEVETGSVPSNVDDPDLKGPKRNTLPSEKDVNRC